MALFFARHLRRLPSFHRIARDSVDGNLPYSPSHFPLAKTDNISVVVNASWANASVSHMAGNPPNAPPFYTGLNGVDLALDAKLVKATWVSIFIVVAAILAMRMAQLFVSYMRHIYCVTATPAQQTYYSINHGSVWPWVKKHVIYAPLWKKRHNREFQLSSAVNHGTLPGRLHALLLALYALSNLVYCLLLDWRRAEQGAIWAELRGRSGVLATVNLIPLVVLAQRNNVAIPILRVSFDTFNLFHRWIGRIVAVESALHFFAWMAAYMQAKGPAATPAVFNHNPFLQSALLGLVAVTILSVHSVSALRHAFYETFLHLHQTLAFLALLGIYVHIASKKLPAYASILTAVVLFLGERVWRLARLGYLNYARRCGCTTLVVEALPGAACRLTFHLPRHVTIRPGSHVYAYIPSISWWMSHPFSVAWTNAASDPAVGVGLGPSLGGTPFLDMPKSLSALEGQSITRRPATDATPTSVSLIAVVRTGMTRQLYEAARRSDRGTLHLTGLLEGPYAGHDSLVSYGTVVMFAGGAGITHHLVQIRHLLVGAMQHTVATRRIVLVWSIRDTEVMEWVRPWMNDILHLPGRRDILKILVYVSRPTRSVKSTANKPTMAVVVGRVDPGGVLDDVLPQRVGAVMVSVCGPGALADEVRSAVRGRMHLANMDMNEESFTW